MKILAFTLALLTIGAALLSCATTDAGNRPRPTTAATTRAEPEPEPPAVAEIAWAKYNKDPWADWQSPNTPELGKLYYQLDPKLTEGQTTDENTRYVMSFTYITADFYRYDLNEYLLSCNLQAHVYEEGEETSYIKLFDLTEAEIKSITPESVQAYYGLESAPAVIGIHRNSSATSMSESAWYRADLLWGTMYMYDVFSYQPGTVNFEDPLSYAENYQNPDRALAIWCEVYSSSDKSCKEYFEGIGWEILDEAYCLLYRVLLLPSENMKFCSQA